MRRETVLVMMLVVLVGLIGVERAFALRRVGVNPGDWCEYGVVWSGNGTLPDPQYRAEWAKVIVEEVSGMNVTYELIMRMADMSEHNLTYVDNLETGQPTGGVMIIAANLNEGDLIYTDPPAYSPFVGATINETTYRSILGQVEEVNLWNATNTLVSPGMNYTVSYEYCWFRSTGMLAEATMYQLTQVESGNITEFSGSSNTTWLEAGIIILNIIPEFPSSLILPLFMMVTLLAVIVYGRKPIKRTY